MLLPSGIPGGKLVPEAVRVVHVTAVGKLVQDNVVVQERREQDEPPVERKRARGRTGPPAGRLIPDANLGHRHAYPPGKPLDGEG